MVGCSDLAWATEASLWLFQQIRTEALPPVPERASLLLVIVNAGAQTSQPPLLNIADIITDLGTRNIQQAPHQPTPVW